MADEHWKFEWQRDLAGYELIANDQGPATTELFGRTFSIRRKEKMGDIRTFIPKKGLHREFATDVHDNESALEFVKKYGFLGFADSYSSTVEEALKNLPSREQAFLKLLLPKIYRLDKDQECVLSILAAAEHMRKALELIKKERKALTALDKKARLTNFKSLAKIFNFHAKPEGILQVALLESDQRQFKDQFVPVSLISYLWFQVSQELTAGIEWARCWVCQGLFDINRRDGRSRRREYCGKFSCEKAGSRKKQELRNNVTKNRSSNRG